MKIKKKFLALALVAVMIASCVALVACNDKGGGSGDLGAYVLTDKATYLSYKNNPEGDKIKNLSILFEQGDDLKNTYSMIAVDPNSAAFAGIFPTLNTVGADCFIKWMSLASTRTAIAEYGVAKYGGALFTLLEGAQTFTGDASALTYAASGATDRVISISTTTSVNDSGLLGALEPIFEDATGFDIEIASAGTGAAISSAKDGNADLLLVHSASQEKTFAPWARKVVGLTGEPVDAACQIRIPFMYNFFVLVGPSKDPAKAKDAANVKDAFIRIAVGNYSFVSRGDKSGTHTAEIKLWPTTLGITDIVANLPSGIKNWYVSAGQGMGACLNIASNTVTKA